MNILEQNRIKTDNNYDDTNFIEIIKKNIQSLSEPLIVSLSGGVDSMVILYIIKKILNKKIISIHINYNNRKESIDEENYLLDYCKELDIVFECINLDVKRRDISRSSYEKYATNIRYSFYKEMIEKYSSNSNSNSILLGHHKDDQIENIFHNFMKNKNLFNLKAIDLFGIRKEVNICRPLIDFYKIEIYSFANKWNIPYFNDTTPNWSARGIFRKIIQPALEQSYYNPKQNILNVNNQLNDWSDIIDNFIINPIMNDIKWNEKSVELCFEKLIGQKQILWMEIIKKIYHKYLINCPSNKSIYNLINNLNEGTTIRLTKNSTSIIYKNNNIIIYFN